MSSGHYGWSGDRRRREKIWAFIVVSVEGNRQGGVSKIGWFESLHQALSPERCPGLSGIWPW